MPKRSGPRSHSSRNPELVPGVPRLSRSAIYKKSGRWAVKNKKEHPKKEKKEVEAPKASAWYPADDVKKPLRNRKNPKPTKLRSSIQPGSVLIVLAGRFRGKRVVFLKQLESGLLLVTGPYKVNGVPLRRINQAYVIATSAKVELPQVDLGKFNDDYFRKPEEKKEKKSEDQFFAQEPKKNEISEERKKDQVQVDSQVMPAVEKTPLMKHYLRARFSLKKGQHPHTMKF